MKVHLSIFLVLLFIASNTHAQKVIGFWEVKKVEVGGQILTPVAKWTKIHKDGTYQSGNGWLQNSEGIWTFDSKNKLFSPKESNGIKDEFGPFTVDVKDDTMTWLREEEGSIVTVTLEKITEIPKAPADYLIGLWDLTTIEKNGEDITNMFDPNNKYYLFMRWDHICTLRTSQGNRTSSYWFMNAHKPEITLIPHDKADPSESWKIEIDSSSLKMFGISNSNIGMIMNFKRLNEFPN